MVRRIFLFFALNFLVVLMISIILNLLNIRPYLDAYGIHMAPLLAFCLIWGMGGALISLFLSRSMAKWALGVKLIDPNTQDPSERHLLQSVRTMSTMAGLPVMPQVGIYRSNEINAFATGPTQKKALVAVSSGLLSRMNQGEIAGVIGHELTHIANGDMVTMTLLQGVVNAFVMFLARILAFAISGMGRNNRQSSQSNASFYGLTILFEIIFMILGSMVVAAFSRYREFRADAGGARVAGRENMIQALQALKNLSQIKDPKEQPALAALKISHTGQRGLLRLFATHPPLDDRIARLKAR